MTDLSERHKDCVSMGECQDCPDSTGHPCDTAIAIQQRDKAETALAEWTERAHKWHRLTNEAEAALAQARYSFARENQSNIDRYDTAIQQRDTLAEALRQFPCVFLSGPDEPNHSCFRCNALDAIKEDPDA